MRRILALCLVGLVAGCSLVSLSDLSSGGLAEPTSEDLDGATDGDGNAAVDARADSAEGDDGATEPEDGGTDASTADANDASPSDASDDSGSVTDAADAADTGSGDAGIGDAATVDASDAGLTYEQTVMADLPVGYWRFEDTPGSTTALATAGGVNPQVVGSVSFDPGGAVGRGAYFTSGRFDLGDTYDLIGTTPFTAEMWAKPIVTKNFQNMLYKRASLGNNRFNGYAFYFYDDSDPGGDGPVVAGGVQWWNDARYCQASYPANAYVYVVATYDSANGLELYVNGQRIPGCYTGAGGPTDTTVPFTMGQNFKGWIDEVALYDHRLTPARISAHYAAAGH